MPGNLRGILVAPKARIESNVSSSDETWSWESDSSDSEDYIPFRCKCHENLSEILRATSTSQPSPPPNQYLTGALVEIFRLGVDVNCGNDLLRNVETYSHFVYFFTLPVDESLLSLLLRLYIVRNNKQGNFHEDKFKFEGHVQPGKKFARQALALARTVYCDEMDEKYEELALGNLLISACIVCSQTRVMMLRKCCNYNICSECIAIYISKQVTDKREDAKVECPNCHSVLANTEVKFRMKYSTVSRKNTSNSV